MISFKINFTYPTPLEWHNNYNLPQKYTNNKSHHHYKYSATLLNKKPIVYRGKKKAQRFSFYLQYKWAIYILEYKQTWILFKSFILYEDTYFVTPFILVLGL